MRLRSGLIVPDYYRRDRSIEIIDPLKMPPLPDVGRLPVVPLRCAIQIEGSAVGSTASGQTCTSALTPTAGWSVFAWCATKAGDTITSVVDNLGNAMTAAFNSTRYALFYVASCPVGVTGYTLTVGTSNCALIVQAFSGLDATPLDQVSTINTGSGTAQTSNAVTTAQNDELLLGYFYQTSNTGDFGAGTGWTLIGNQDLTAQSENLGGAYRIVSSTGSYSALGTSASVNWAANIATFKATAGTGGDPNLVGDGGAAGMCLAGAGGLA